MKKFSIYQLPIGNSARFMGLDFVRECDIMPELTDYKKVYEGEVEESATLDDLFHKFNVGFKPEGYTGHSMCTSDVVEINGEYFYCDNYGWEQVFQA